MIIGRKEWCRRRIEDLERNDKDVKKKINLAKNAWKYSMLVNKFNISMLEGCCRVRLIKLAGWKTIGFDNKVN